MTIMKHIVHENGVVEVMPMTEHEEQEFLANMPELPFGVQKVTAAQARLALDHAGILDHVEQVIAAHPVRAVRIWYEHALEWDRGNVYVQALAAELGLTDEEVDVLFTVASMY